MTTTRQMGLVLGLASSLAFSVACGSDDGSSNAGPPGDGAAGMGSDPDAMDGSGGSEADGDGMGGAASADEPTVVDVASEAGSFTSLVGALEAAGLVDTLSGDGEFTVFAPDDAAFEAFETENPGVLASLSDDELRAVLTYHVVGAEVRSNDLVSGSIAETLSGDYVAIDLSEGVKVNAAEVTSADIDASNGVIHVIDRVILPPSDNIVQTAVSAGSFTQLASALVATGLDEALSGEGPFTVFAPTDAAFEAFEAENPGVLASLSAEQLSSVLLYHVTDGWVGAADLEDGASVPTLLEGASLSVDLSSSLMVNNSNVDAANVLTSNGVIHVIDEILLPPSP
jgi:transforming growth factor-beta-induced protein